MYLCISSCYTDFDGINDDAKEEHKVYCVIKAMVLFSTLISGPITEHPSIIVSSDWSKLDLNVDQLKVLILMFSSDLVFR